MTSPDTLQALWRSFEARGSLPALIAFSGHQAETWSFAELHDISGRAGMALVRRGIGRDDGVALVAPNSLRWIAAFWGIAAAGAVAVPLDAQNDDRELGRMIEIGACRLAFTTSAIAPRLHVIAPSCQTVILDDTSETVVEEGWRRFLASVDAPLPLVAAADTAVDRLHLGDDR